MTNSGSRYLCSCIKQEDTHKVYWAVSEDGFNWAKLAEPLDLFENDLAGQYLCSDVMLGPDGKFHALWQMDSRQPAEIFYAFSKDLIHWSKPKTIKPMADQEAYDIVSPKLFYDHSIAQYIISWAITLKGNYFQAYQEDIDDNPRLWYSATRDFETFTPAKVFFEPGYSAQDGLIVQFRTGYALIHNDYRKRSKSLRVAFSDTSAGPWQRVMDILPLKSCQPSAVLKTGDEIIVYANSSESVKALVTKDFYTWQDCSDYIFFPEGFKSGNILKADLKIVDSLSKNKSIQ